MLDVEKPDETQVNTEQTQGAQTQLLNDFTQQQQQQHTNKQIKQEIIQHLWWVSRLSSLSEA